jgi:hypothetical protein
MKKTWVEASGEDKDTGEEKKDTTA